MDKGYNLATREGRKNYQKNLGRRNKLSAAQHSLIDKVVILDWELNKFRFGEVE